MVTRGQRKKSREEARALGIRVWRGPKRVSERWAGRRRPRRPEALRIRRVFREVLGVAWRRVIAKGVICVAGSVRSVE